MLPYVLDDLTAVTQLLVTILDQAMARRLNHLHAQYAKRADASRNDSIIRYKTPLSLEELKELARDRAEAASTIDHIRDIGIEITEDDISFMIDLRLALSQNPPDLQKCRELLQKAIAHEEQLSKLNREIDEEYPEEEITITGNAESDNRIREATRENFNLEFWKLIERTLDALLIVRECWQNFERREQT